MEKQERNKGLAISIGAGIGLVLGPGLFDNAVVGLCLGAGIGIALASFSKSKSN